MHMRLCVRVRPSRQCVCTCVCARVCVHVCACTCECARVCVHVCVRAGVCARVCARGCATSQEQKISLTKFTNLHSIMFLAKQVDLPIIGRPAPSDLVDPPQCITACTAHTRDPPQQTNKRTRRSLGVRCLRAARRGVCVRRLVQCCPVASALYAAGSERVGCRGLLHLRALYEVHQGSVGASPCQPERRVATSRTRTP